MFFLILTLPGSFYTPLHINSCFKSVIKIVGESATFDQKKKISKKKYQKYQHGLGIGIFAAYFNTRF